MSIAAFIKYKQIDLYMFLNEKQRHRLFQRENKKIIKGKTQVDVVLIGSSTTQKFEIQGKIPFKTILNRGISGDTSLGVLNRVKRDVIDLAPKKVIVLIGTNDTAKENYRKEEVLENIQRIVEAIQKKSPKTKIYLQAIYPINRSFNVEDLGLRSNEKIEVLNEAIEKIAHEKAVHYFSLNDYISDEAGRLKADYTYDGLHMTPKGYEVIFKHIQKIL